MQGAYDSIKSKQQASRSHGQSALFLIQEGQFYMKNEADAKLTVDTRVSPKNPEEYIRSLCLMDDIFMAKCFEDNIECTELAERTSYFKNEKKGEAVISLIKSKTIPIEKISEIMSLPLDEVKRIAQDIEESDIS